MRLSHLLPALCVSIAVIVTGNAQTPASTDSSGEDDTVIPQPLVTPAEPTPESDASETGTDSEATPAPADNHSLILKLLKGLNETEQTNEEPAVTTPTPSPSSPIVLATPVTFEIQQPVKFIPNPITPLGPTGSPLLGPKTPGLGPKKPGL